MTALSVWSMWWALFRSAVIFAALWQQSTTRQVLFSPPIRMHQHHAVGDFERFLLVVCDEDAGDVQLVVQAAQPAPQLLAHLGVERAEGLVEQQHARLDGERAGQRDALALAARELRREAVGEPVELHEVEQLVHFALDH